MKPTERDYMHLSAPPTTPQQSELPGCMASRGARCPRLLNVPYAQLSLHGPAGGRCRELQMRAGIGVFVIGLSLMAPLSAGAQETAPPRPADQIEDRADRREDRRDRREDVRDHRENIRDRREDRRDRLHDGGVRDRREDVRDRREDIRDRRENVRDRREDRRDRRR